LDKWKKIAIGTAVAASFTLPVFRSGGRTHLTFWQWVWNHTIFGPPIQFIPEEDYQRELEVAATQLISRQSTRVAYEDHHILVSVREPGEWYDILDFVQPDNPDVLAVLSHCGPDRWSLYDFVCRNINYRRDIGEFWQIPSETLANEWGDCEDSAILLCSLLQNAYVALGNYGGQGHAWVLDEEGEILESTYTSARRVADPENYITYALFNHLGTYEFWDGALQQILDLRRDEKLKLKLMSRALTLDKDLNSN